MPKLKIKILNKNENTKSSSVPIFCKQLKLKYIYKWFKNENISDRR
jgi:hypothetical protein